MCAARRILVVDDEPVVIKSCRRILSGLGYDVDVTESGREGLDRASDQDFDLVMTDLRMPDLDGMELVRTLRGRKPQTAIVVITGYGTIPSAVEAIQLGVSDYIEKPFTPAQIADAVHGALADAADMPPFNIEAESVRRVLRLAAKDGGFANRLLTEGSRVLSGLSLSSEAKAAIVSGDVAWIEKLCGELSPEERDWLERRLQAEIW